MLRPLNSLVRACIVRPNVPYRFFFHAQFAQGTGVLDVYFWSGIGNVTVGGITYTGAGSLLTMSPIETAPDGAASIYARNVEFTLSGLDPILASESLNDFLQGAPVTVAIAYYDAQGNMQGLPVIAWQGRMDLAKVASDGSTSSISISAENVLVDLQRSREKFYIPSDTGNDPIFAFVWDLQSKPWYFGTKAGSKNNTV